MLSIAPKQPVGGERPAPASAATSASPAAARQPEPGGENREAARRPASAVPSIRSVRISPHGVDATLVNISESGVLTECGERLKPGSAVTVVFEGTFVPRTVEGRVARNTVSAMGKDGRLRYHVGISFTKPIQLVIPGEGAPGLNVPGGAPGLNMTPTAPAAPLNDRPALVPHVVRNRW